MQTDLNYINNIEILFSQNESGRNRFIEAKDSFMSWWYGKKSLGAQRTLGILTDNAIPEIWDTFKRNYSIIDLPSSIRYDIIFVFTDPPAGDFKLDSHRFHIQKVDERSFDYDRIAERMYNNLLDRGM
ncbi:hypothetical protein ACFQMJ_15710 [Cohnella cellulosilytica]|uniref:Uncharacterized protein n=2 Tax=Cohnella cellulosilytica TaxID=986710 RepID=A0ABW2FCE9_9BACL